MFHRVQNKSIQIPEIYKNRNMEVEIKELLSIIDLIQNNGYKIGSIQDTLDNSKFFHITFDDGFKEHLEVAQIIKSEFNFKPESITYSINIGNSLERRFSGMDITYQIMLNNDIHEIIKRFHLTKADSDSKLIELIKEKVLRMTPNELIRLHEEFGSDVNALEETFLNSEEVKELSKLYNIASHGQSHRDLTNHLQISSQEVTDSKAALEKLINKRVITFCYPEGRNNKALQDSCKRAGFEYGLSIKHEENNPYSIGRFCVNNHRKELMERINE